MGCVHIAVQVMKKPAELWSSLRRQSYQHGRSPANKAGARATGTGTRVKVKATVFCLLSTDLRPSILVAKDSYYRSLCWGLEHKSSLADLVLQQNQCGRHGSLDHV
jgi:hypothetical protein